MGDKDKKLTTSAEAAVLDNQNVMTAGSGRSQLLQGVWSLEKLGRFNREVTPGRRMHAKGYGAFGTFTATHDMTRYNRAKLFAQIGKATELLARLMTVAGAIRVDGNHGEALSYEPNSGGEWLKQPEFREPALNLDGAADHWNHRGDTDYYSQLTALFRLMNSAQ